MCCFLAPLAEAVVATVCRKTIDTGKHGNALSENLPALEKMLWGGTLMLVVDHIINGEVTWRYPFFTALGETGGVQVMLREILTVGVPMCAVLTAAWVVWSLLRSRRASLSSR